MTEAEAWQMIGEAFDQYAYTGVRPDGVAHFGLCSAVYVGAPDNLTSPMLHKVYAELNGPREINDGYLSSAFLWHYDQEGASYRAALAYLFAAEAAA